MNASTPAALASPAFKAAAKDYARYFSGLDAFLIEGRPFICPFEAIADHIRGGRMLDIGCGNGFLLYALNRGDLISQGTGVEVKESSVAAGASALRRAGVDTIELLCVDTIEGWPQAHFDIVTMVDVLHHVPPAGQKAFVEAALARVAPGGLFLYKDICRRPAWMAFANRLHDLLLARQWINYVEIEDVKRWAQARGFSVVAAGAPHLLWYSHEFVVLQRQAG